MAAESPDTLKLHHGPLSLELAPFAGGSIAAFRLERDDRFIDLMRPADEQALQSDNATGFSCFPMVPYSNRIEHGKFEFGDKRIQLQLNMMPHPHSIHGHGFQNPWQIIEYTHSSAAMVYEHSGGESGWPWVYRAEQHFTLTDDSLVTSLSIKNCSQEPMPAGLGMHPYFPKTDDVQLDIGLNKVWMPDNTGVPQTLADIPEQWQLTNHRKLHNLVLDYCFTDWNGNARIVWPEHNIGLTLSHTGLFKHMVIYIPEKQNYFCIEPVSHITNAFNLANQGIENTGLRVLDPNEIVYAELRYKLAIYDT
jgi:aldose 1-epimerase